MAEAIQGLKITVGTKVDDVYTDKEAFEQARLADKNGDHVIDKDELNRYVGPVFAENVTTKKGRIEGSVMVPTAFGYRIGSLSAVLLKDNEVDYYPEMTFDKVKNGRDMKTFSEIDITGDKSLSAEEITLYGNKQKVKELEQDKIILQEQLKSQKRGLKQGLGMFGTAGIVMGTLGLIGGEIGGAIGLGAFFGVIPCLVFLGAYLITKNSIQKAMSNCDNQLKELEPQVKKGAEEILGKTKETK